MTYDASVYLDIFCTILKPPNLVSVFKPFLDILHNAVPFLRLIIFLKMPTLIWGKYNAKHQKPKYVFPWNRTLKARVDFKSKTGCGLRKKLWKPNPNRIAVQLNLWKLCISAKSQKQLVLQSLNFHIWHRVLIHIGKFGDSFLACFLLFLDVDSNKCKTELL